MIKRAVFVAIAAIFIAGGANAALNPNMDNSSGNLITHPWQVDGGDKVTVSTVTNALTTPQTVHITVYGETWNATDWDCPLTPMETTYLVFETFDHNYSKVSVECSYDYGLLQVVQTRFVHDRQGFAVVQGSNGAAHDTAAKLIGDFVIIDFADGYAWSANAWHFNASPLTGYSVSTNPPTVLATSFIAPDLTDVTADLILYNLNGAPGWSAPAAFGALAYDDDEVPVSAFYKYDCFVVASLYDIFGPNVFRRPGYFVGHTSLFATAHGAFGVTPTVVGSIGWIFQTIAWDSSLNGGQSLGGGSMLGNVMSDNAAWGRKMLHEGSAASSQLLHNVN